MFLWLLAFFGKSRKSSPLENLPNEILIEIAKYLTPRGLCPLLQTSRRFYELLIQELYKCGLELKYQLSDDRYNKYRFNKFPLLIWAVVSRNYPLACFLLENGVDVNSRGGIFWETPLHYAAKDNESCQFLNLLLENGADIGALDCHKRTPLHCATEANAAILLDKGADVEALDRDCYRPFYLALKTQNCEQLIKLFIRKGASVRSEGVKRNKLIPLFLAVMYKPASINIIKILLDSGADIDARGDEGWTVLHLAATRGSSSIIKLLLARGAKKFVNTLTYISQKSPLDMALETGDDRMVNILLKNGARRGRPVCTGV